MQVWAFLAIQVLLITIGTVTKSPTGLRETRKLYHMSGELAYDKEQSTD